MGPTTDAQPSGFDAVFDAGVAYVHRTLLRLGVAPRDVEDAVQDVFVAVHGKMAGFDPSRPLRPWLFTFAYHHATNYRRLARHRVISDRPPPEREERSPGPDPEQTMQETEARALVLRVLEHLPDERRDVFVAHEIDGLAPSEIADALGIPVNTVYSRLRVAREEFAHVARRVVGAAHVRKVAEP